MSVLEVVVVDDVCRFACHVFHYLSETIGFGIGQVPDDGGGISFTSGEPLLTPAGHARVWWVDAGDQHWRQKLTSVSARIRSRQARFLVDVRGSQRSHLKKYEFKEVVKLLIEQEKRTSAEIIPVSSYRTSNLEIDGEERPIRAKTWKVLQDLADEIADKIPRREPRLEGLHILVTGAGFELAENSGGCQGLGMPLTSAILKEGWIRSGNSKDSFDESDAFPIPRDLVSSWGGDPAALRRAAQDWNLDAYWNEALKLILEDTHSSPSTGDARERKAAASRQEHKAREDFRHAFLRYDWGQLNQALDAAALSWTAWLSTNYTGFADRALSLYERDIPRPCEKTSSDSSEHWSIVSTSHEAVHLTRRLLHGDRPEGRFLFKLHGHIEHLLTMAIAGQDKEIYSTLSLPVDSLHEVYTAAELYLERRLLGQRNVFWHIVGHRMKDALLEDLLLRVCANAPNDLHHTFIFVRPHAAVKEHFDHFSSPGSARQVVAVPCHANQYLARLRRWGLTAEHEKDLIGWSRLMTGKHEI